MKIEIADIVSATNKNLDWKLPSHSEQFWQTYLTGVLRKMPEFQRALLPNSRRVITRINKTLKKSKHIEPCDEIKNKRLYSTVSLAVDRGALLLYEQNVTEKPIQYLRNLDYYEKRIATIILKSASNK